LLIQDREGRLYRAGTTQECQIFVNYVQVDRAGAIRIKAQELQISDDQPMADYLDGLQGTYITGVLTLDDADDLTIPSHQDRFDPITLQPGRDGSAVIRLESASPTEVLDLLGDYYARGNLLIRTVESL